MAHNRARNLPGRTRSGTQSGTLAVYTKAIHRHLSQACMEMVSNFETYFIFFSDQIIVRTVYGTIRVCLQVPCCTSHCD